MQVNECGDAIVVDQVGAAIVIRSANADATACGLARVLAADPSGITVVVGRSAAHALETLDPYLLDRLKRHLAAAMTGRHTSGSHWDVRLVAPRAASPSRPGTPPVAARLADQLGLSVVAPDGELVALRGGELFSAGPGKGWLAFRPDGRVEWTGPRYPAPLWQAALAAEYPLTWSRPASHPYDRRSPSALMTVTSIPAGLWLRVPYATPLPLVDFGFGIPVEPGRPVVLVGAPDELMPTAAELADFVGALDADLRETFVLVPYGQAPADCGALAQSLADRTGTAVRSYDALPHYAADGSRGFAVFGDSGRPLRLSDAPETEYLPGDAASSWTRHYRARRGASRSSAA